MSNDGFHYVMVGAGLGGLMLIAALSGCSPQQAAVANNAFDDICTVAANTPLSPQDQALVGAACVGGKVAVAVASDPATQQALLSLKARIQAAK